jgi:hypothetical protein
MVPCLDRIEIDAIRTLLHSQGSPHQFSSHGGSHRAPLAENVRFRVRSRKRGMSEKGSEAEWLLSARSWTKANFAFDYKRTLLSGVEISVSRPDCVENSFGTRRRRVEF